MTYLRHEIIEKINFNEKTMQFFFLFCVLLNYSSVSQNLLCKTLGLNVLKKIKCRAERIEARHSHKNIIFNKIICLDEN